MKYRDDIVWAMAHSQGTPYPFIVGSLTAMTRRDLISKIETDVCGHGRWRQWSRQTGAKIVKVRVTQEPTP